MPKIGTWATNTYDKLKGTAKKFGAEDASLIAAAISFYVFLTLLPLLLLAIAVLGYVVGSSDKAYDAVVGFFNSFVPTSTFVTDALRGLVQARGVIGWIGIISLLWTGSQLFVTLQIALDNIWGVVEKPGLVKSRIKAIIMVLVFGVFLLLTLGSSSFVTFLHSATGSVGGWASGAIGVLLSIAAIVISLVFAIAMFFVIYKFVPDKLVKWQSALVGALFAGITWTIAKELYRLYVTYFADFNKLYGSIGGIILLIIWIYYSSVILLYGAELAYVDEYGAVEQPEEKERLEEG